MTLKGRVACYYFSSSSSSSSSNSSRSESGGDFERSRGVRVIQRAETNSSGVSICPDYDALPVNLKDSSSREYSGYPAGESNEISVFQ